MNKKNLLIFLWILSLLAVDLMSKYYLFDLRMLSDYPFIHPIINIGVSFSREISYFLVIPLSIVAICSFLYLYTKNAISDWTTILFVAWAMGNLYDRILYDGVRDFLVVFDWFICNIADIYLSLAIILFLFSTIYHKESPHNK